jgi:methanogenic corrinoid protein MtbC1
VKPLLSPRELAQAIGVSESSLKRWADDGLIHVSRTAGGHRRIPIAEAIRFIRDTHAVLVRPDILGLPELDLSAQTAPDESGSDRLLGFLQDGRGSEARGLILSWYLSGRDLPELFDGPMRSAMERIGQRWTDDPDGIFIEHRASSLCMESMIQLQTIIETPHDALRAVGGAPSGDTGALATLAAATVLTAEGFHAVNLGPQTPYETLARAAQLQDAALVWLSITHDIGPDELRTGVETLSRSLQNCNARLIVGGRAVDPLVAKGRPNVHVGRSMAELAAFAKGLRLARTPA